MWGLIVDAQGERVASGQDSGVAMTFAAQKEFHSSPTRGAGGYGHPLA
jgi:hypothetical protein